MTPNIGLTKPAYQDPRWDIPVNNNFDIIDTAVGDRLNTADLQQGIDDRMADGLQPLINTGRVTTRGQIIYDQATDQIYEDMYLRIGPGGSTALHRVVDSDTHWVDVDQTEIPLTTTPLQVLSVTPTLDVTTLDGSYNITGMVSNTNNQAVTLIVSSYVDGVLRATETVSIPRTTSNMVLGLSSPISSGILANQVVTVEFSASLASVLTLNGTTLDTKLLLTKAITLAAALGEINDRIHRVATYNGSLGNSPSKAHITQAVMSTFNEPIESNGSFYLTDNNHRVFSVVWIAPNYYYERVTRAL